MPDTSQFNIDRTDPGRWTITFSNPPINIFVPSTIVELGALMTDIEADPSVKIFSLRISMWPRRWSVQTCWAFGATLCFDFRPRQS